MRLKNKILFTLGVPFLLFLAGCPTEEELAEKFQKKHRITKSVQKKVALVGEPIHVVLKLKNLSRHHIDEFSIQKETRKGNFLTVGEKIIDCYHLDGHELRTFSYSIIPLSPGTLYIPPSKITNFKVRTTGDSISIPSGLGHSNAVRIKVLPVDISVKQIQAQRNALVGEKLDVSLVIKNHSPFDVDSFEIRMDGANSDFVFPQKIPKSGPEIKSGQKFILPYAMIPKSPGKKIICVMLRRVRFKGRSNIFYPQWNSGPGHGIEINVKPLRLQASHFFDRAEIKLDQQFNSTLYIQNQGKAKLEGIKYSFSGDVSSFKQLDASNSPTSLSLPPGETRTISFTYRAVKAGTVKPGKIVINEIKVSGHWIDFDNRFLATPNIPPVKIRALRLPGYGKPVENICPELENYYENFLLKTTGIVFGFGLLLAGFKLILSSIISEFFYGKVALASFAGLILGALSVFLCVGVYWVWPTKIPPLDVCAALWAGSCFCAFIFGMFRAFRNLNFIYGTLLAGTCLTLLSYVLFTGYKCFEHNNFENFPVGITAFLVFGASLGLNATIFRKI